MSRQENIVTLRPLEPEDIDILYQWENNPDNWEVSNTRVPFSRHLLEHYIANAHTELYTSGQLRLVICSGSEAVGLIDLFEYDAFHQRAGVGILVAPEHRGKHIAKEALQQMIDYGFTHLGLHQLYCNISEDNNISQTLFQSVGFVKCGEKKDWIKTPNGFKDEWMYQLLRDSN